MIKYSKVTVEPASEPVSLQEAKDHLYVTDTAQDAYIARLITTSRTLCEKYAGLSFITQTRVMKLDCFPVCSPYEIEVPYGPVQSITAFSYTKSDGTTGTLANGTDYRLDNSSDLTRLSPVSLWPSDQDIRINAISITYVAGYTEVPEVIKQAMLLQIGSLYENRQDEVSGGTSLLNWSSSALLDTVKVYWNANQEN